jgi:hypothetical protein
MVMTTIPIAFIFGAGVCLLCRYAGLKVFHAAVCILFGFSLASTMFAPDIHNLISSIFG